MSLRLVPVDWATARGFTRSWHRSHPKPPAGHKFIAGVATDDDVLVGVVIVGRPTSRVIQQREPLTLEATRTVTDGHKNANSMLYGAAARGAFAQGYRRVITYNQDGESGASLLAAGYIVVAELPARNGWDTPSRPRDNHGTDHIPRKLWERAS